MLSGLIRILSKIKWWFKYSLKHRDKAGCFCPTCRFYDQCKWEAEYVESVFNSIEEMPDEIFFGDPLEVDDDGFVRLSKTEWYGGNLPYEEGKNFYEGPIDFGEE